MLLLAGAALVLPAVFELIDGGRLPSVGEEEVNYPNDVETMSAIVAVILLVTYAAGLLFRLQHAPRRCSTRHDEGASTPARRGRSSARSSRSRVAGIAVGVMSEILVGSINEASEGIGISQFFVGLIVVAIVGNAAEHWVAIYFAAKDKMDLSVNIAIGSSAQIALFVAPGPRAALVRRRRPPDGARVQRLRARRGAPGHPRGELRRQRGRERPGSRACSCWRSTPSWASSSSTPDGRLAAVGGARRRPHLLPLARPALLRARARAELPRGRHLEHRLARAQPARRRGHRSSSTAPERAINYTTVYLIERSLSLDNLFVFILLFAYFAVPVELRARLLFFGIVFALVLRGLAILGGVALIEQFDWVIYVLGALLIVLAWRILQGVEEGADPDKNLIVRAVRRVFPVTERLPRQRVVPSRRATSSTRRRCSSAWRRSSRRTSRSRSTRSPRRSRSPRDEFVIWMGNVFALLGPARAVRARRGPDPALPLPRPDDRGRPRARRRQAPHRGRRAHRRRSRAWRSCSSRSRSASSPRSSPTGARPAPAPPDDCAATRAPRRRRARGRPRRSPRRGSRPAGRWVTWNCSMSASRRASSTGASSAISTQSAPSSSSMLKISVSTSTVSSTMITTSVCGLKYVPGRFDELVELERSRISHSARSTPSGRRICLRTSASTSSGSLPAAHPAGVAGLDELADLGLQRRVGGRLASGAAISASTSSGACPRATRRALRASSIWRTSSSRRPAADRRVAGAAAARPRTGRRGRCGRTARRAG